MKGSKTIAQVCGTRWNRLMCPTWAAAYVGYTLPSFRENAELSALKAKMEMSASAAQ